MVRGQTDPSETNSFVFVSQKLVEGVFVEDVPLEYVKKCTQNFCDERKLGTGVFGTVYKGVDPENLHEFAIKVLKLPSRNISVSSDEAFSAIIEEKTAAFKAVSQAHPNLCKVMGVCSGRDESDGRDYLIILSSLGSRGNLGQVLRDDECARSLDWRVRLAIARQICEAAFFLQEQRPLALHRIKSTNVVFTDNLKPMLSDWAISRLLPSSERDSNETAAIGTRGYLCPQHRADGVLAVETETYSIGIVLLELFVGRAMNSDCDLVKEFAGEDLYSQDTDGPPTIHILSVADADERAGKWDQLIASEFADLILGCLRKRRRRLTLRSALRFLCDISQILALPGCDDQRCPPWVPETPSQRIGGWGGLRMWPVEGRGGDREVDLEEDMKCVACMLDFKRKDGADCPRKQKEHFLCKDCFSDYVYHQVEGGLEMRDGTLLLPCPLAGRGCAEGVFFCQRVVALNCKPEAYRKFLESRDHQLRREVRAEVENEVRREGAAGSARRRLEEELSFYSRTPCCGRAFVFDGCAAIACTPTCRQHFCAFCLHHSPTDLHAHVMTCRLNPNPGHLYISAAGLDRVHRPLLHQRVQNFLEQVQRDQPEVHTALMQMESVQRWIADLNRPLGPPPPPRGFLPPPGAFGVWPQVVEPLPVPGGGVAFNPAAGGGGGDGGLGVALNFRDNRVNLNEWVAPQPPQIHLGFEEVRDWLGEHFGQIQGNRVQRRGQPPAQRGIGGALQAVPPPLQPGQQPVGDNGDPINRRRLHAEVHFHLHMPQQEREGGNDRLADPLRLERRVLEAPGQQPPGAAAAAAAGARRVNHAQQRAEILQDALANLQVIQQVQRQQIFRQEPLPPALAQPLGGQRERQQLFGQDPLPPALAQPVGGQRERQQLFGQDPLPPALAQPVGGQRERQQLFGQDPLPPALAQPVGGQRERQQLFGQDPLPPALAQPVGGQRERQQNQPLLPLGQRQGAQQQPQQQAQQVFVPMQRNMFGNNEGPGGQGGR
uniref:Protein kinase domain-containing protein n=1 Tax=Chromera velia CCMP2878 TaxID=1169474 RepID=A0A0G4IBD0_9ALVE|eukprot:Cvel_12832.t1-p1 / transcript=Cvel_12832.t1 / gene=Cvel_12832 / organism=Chromera_velia_CCMP2878 / gene_product=G-type lectin S-receptor-like, putative / transcript_product=G-type lectin S-receptor-like, putative / location=Cvel_scaffold856:9668-13623(-) / protein_length=998 / sequence_SO=supercontig / SO=protein_coding / is_pseudo=false